MEKNILTVTAGFECLIFMTRNIVEQNLRDNLINAGYLTADMGSAEAIAILLVTQLLTKNETEYSPQFMASILINYCPTELADYFIDYYCQVANKRGINITPETLRKQQFDASIDIYNFAKQMKVLEYSVTWNPLREPFSTLWVTGFE